MPNDEVKLLVTVKPIGWMDNSANSLWSGELIFGAYYTLYDEADGWRVFREQFLSERGTDEVAFIRELDAAKAAAQADYEQRILSTLSAIPSTVSGETAAARDVLAERRRQVEAEGFDCKHDDRHQHGELVYAAAAYALAARSGFGASWQRGIIERLWPWDAEWWKPNKPRTNLVKAAALLIADIERMDRASPANPAETQADEVGK